MNNEQFDSMLHAAHKHLTDLKKSVGQAMLDSKTAAEEGTGNEVSEVYRIQSKLGRAFVDAQIEIESLIACRVFEISEPTEGELERRRVLELRT